ncbi:MAG: DUF4442 domain-containing protein [Bacteroidota bacterium]|nr:DUF4442 domain-containing protein [Bacteroidota bacterium]
MKFTPFRINTFLLFKLPSAYFCGVRLKEFTPQKVKTTVRLSWFNQNPFKSMYFAVQAMAAELSTGVLMMYHVQNSGHKISMLVLANKSVFHKKATGRINFISEDNQQIKEVIQRVIQTKEGQTCWIHSKGYNQQGEVVSEFDFQWTIKVK